MGINHARVLMTQQPLVNALQRKLARAMARGAAFAGVGVFGFLILIH
jgi:hypothetical protein